MTKKIRIIKAHNEKAWYADKIGKIYVVSNGEYPLDVGGVMVYRKGTDDSYGVRKGDFEVIIENETEADGMKTRYDLAIEKAREAIEELRLAAYEQGYKDATHDLTAKAPVSGKRKGGLCFHEMTPVKSPQALRDEIVERAKRDVEELKQPPSPWQIERAYVVDSKRCNAEFIINNDKRAVVVLIRWRYDNSIQSKGIAKCAPNDCFNVHIGKAIALRRALGLEVPAEYLNAPQPTEVRVGDIVGFPYDVDDDTRDLIVKVDGEEAVCEDGGFHYTRELFGKDEDGPIFDPRIIDDSREGVGE